MFLYIDPLKQGLKLGVDKWEGEIGLVFIHRSIKTRIETGRLITMAKVVYSVFIHRSIKTRIETRMIQY